MYNKAIAHWIPNFGRAYSGLGVSYLRLGRIDEARAAWNKSAVADRSHDRARALPDARASTRSRSRGNYEQAIENNRALVERYPGDSTGFNNLAVAYFNTLDFQQALEAGRQAIELNPRRVRYRANEALYAMYATDFDGAAPRGQRRPSKLDATYFKAYLPVAMAALDAGDEPRVATPSTAWPRPAAAGLRWRRPGSPTSRSIAGVRPKPIEQLTSGHRGRRARRATRSARPSKYVRARRRASGGRSPAEAAAAATKALSLVAPGHRSRCRRAPVDPGGRRPQAAKLAAELNARLPTHSRAYGRLVDGWLAAEAGRTHRRRRRVPARARKLADFWLTRFSLGVAYVQAGAFAEALSELDACQRRRGEAMAVFLDDVPTARYLAALPYWLGRAQEGLGQRAAAAASYGRFLRTRAESSADPPAVDARRRLSQLN